MRIRIFLSVLALLAVASPSAARQGGATPRPVAGPPSAAAPRGSSEDPATLERVVLEAINAERRSSGLPPLVASPELTELARGYSRDMARRNFFGHRDPDGRAISERVEGIGVRWARVGENIARNRGYGDPAAMAVQEWMKSKGHRENILGDRYRETGVGIWVAPDHTVYFTQIFLTRNQ
jgi:uncharacterized protein YkwD